MHVLMVDTYEFSYLPTATAPQAGLQDQGEHDDTFAGGLVAFLAIESRDDERSVRRAARGIVDVAKRLQVTRIVLMPNVHLAKNIARDDNALKKVKELAAELSTQTEIPVIREAFGYTGELRLHSKGHPLAVLGRRY